MEPSTDPFASWPLNPVDLIVLCVVLMSAILAFVRGFIREFMSLMTWVVASASAAYFFPQFQEFWREQISSALFADMANMAVTFIVAMVVMNIVSHLISNLVQGKIVGSIDRSLGFAFGALRGLLILFLGYMVASWFFPPEKQPKWVLAAQSQAFLNEGASTIKGWIPQAKFKIGETKFGYENLQEGYNKIQDSAKDLINPMSIQNSNPQSPPQPANNSSGGSGSTRSLR